MKDYYSILGIASNSDKSEIQRAYRRLAKKYHPDVNKAADAHDKFIEISEAYEFLIHNLNYYKKGQATTTGSVQNDLGSQLFQEFERLRQDAREKAQRQAQMRYEEFRKQNEAFMVSGMHDLVLLINIIGRIALVFISVFLFFAPLYFALNYGWKILIFAFFAWPFAAGLAWNAYDKRKNYFKPGKFYYTFGRIKTIFTERNLSEEKCFYCSDKLADSKPYKIELLKLKEIKLQTSGFRQHNVNYKNKIINISIPRSKKAFTIHTINIGIKILSILLCMIFLNISSHFWTFIFGLVLGGIVSSVILFISDTKSNVSYLFSYGFLFRISVWLVIIISLSSFNTDPLNITTSDGIYFAVIAILLFDSLLMQISNLILGKYSVMPILKQYDDLNQKLNDGYKFYNDINVISVLFPVFKWIFG